MFCTPISAKCVSADGSWSTDCLVLCVWDSGAHLRQAFRLVSPSSIFYSRPVKGRSPGTADFLSICGHVIEVAYLLKQPAFLLKRGRWIDEPRNKRR